MKKTVLTIAIALMMGTAFAQQGGGALKRSQQYEAARNENNMRNGSGLLLPSQHGTDTDTNGADGPLGSGVAVLLGLGAAYLVGKKRREE